MSSLLVGTAAALLLATLAGCEGSVSERQAERLVRAYDEGLVSAYRQRSVEPVKDLVTMKEMKKLIVLIDLKASNRVVLESSLEALAVRSVRLKDPGRLEVETEERWRYFDRPLDPGRPPGQVFVADMAMRYEFVRENGRWKMDQGRTLSCDFIEPKGFAPPPPRSRGHERSPS